MRLGPHVRIALLLLVALAECAPTVARPVVPVRKTGPAVIFEGRSEYSSVVVLQDGDQRCLAFGSKWEDRETCIDLKNPDRAIFEYTRMMFVAMLFQPEAARVLHIGLGGGFMPSVFTRHLPAIHVDTVEIDPLVITVARKYFGFEPGEHLTVTQADGRKYIEKSTVGYDQIWVDAFDEKYVPPQLTTRQFLEAARARLNPHGILVENLHYSHPLFPSQVVTARAVFKHVWLFEGVDCENAVLVATDDPACTPEEMPEKAKRFKGRIGAIDLLEEAAKYRPDMPVRNGKILEDQK
jgi:spermidine synthase